MNKKSNNVQRPAGFNWDELPAEFLTAIESGDDKTAQRILAGFPLAKQKAIVRALQKMHMQAIKQVQDAMKDMPEELVSAIHSKDHVAIKAAIEALPEDAQEDAWKVVELLKRNGTL